MRDRTLILAGLAAFLGIASFPLWHNLAAKTRPAMPQLRLPAFEKECVAPIQYMETSHMKLLRDWREQAVRGGNRTYKTADGRVFKISLTGTCLRQCHEDKAAFCDRCHEYNGVKSPNCWDCHLDRRQEVAPAQTRSTTSGGPNGLR